MHNITINMVLCLPENLNLACGSSEGLQLWVTVKSLRRTTWNRPEVDTPGVDRCMLLVTHVVNWGASRYGRCVYPCTPCILSHSSQLSTVFCICLVFLEVKLSINKLPSCLKFSQHISPIETMLWFRKKLCILAERTVSWMWYHFCSLFFHKNDA